MAGILPSHPAGRRLCLPKTPSALSAKKLRFLPATEFKGGRQGRTEWRSLTNGRFPGIEHVLSGSRFLNRPLVRCERCQPASGTPDEFPAAPWQRERYPSPFGACRASGGASKANHAPQVARSGVESRSVQLLCGQGGRDCSEGCRDDNKSRCKTQHRRNSPWRKTLQMPMWSMHGLLGRYTRHMLHCPSCIITSGITGDSGSRILLRNYLPCAMTVGNVISSAQKEKKVSSGGECGRSAFGSRASYLNARGELCVSAPSRWRQPRAWPGRQSRLR